MADPHDSARPGERAARMRPLVGLPGETAGEAVAKALQARRLARQRVTAAEPDPEQPATTEDSDAT